METFGDTMNRPRFHMAPPSAWINDPNGPLLYKGRYHLFHQHVADSTSWTWGLAWGHASSDDLVRWKRLPLALQPTPDGFDRDGCFSGCATIDADGTPALLYTGVVRKQHAPHLTPSSVTVTKMCTERQLLARATDPDDLDLKSWTKAQQPWLSEPPAQPPHGPVSCWRDPFVLQRPSGSNGHRWRVMIGSGVGDPVDDPEHQARGTALVYSSSQLDSGWELEGELCRALTYDHGPVWECPLLCELPVLGGSPASHASSSSTGQHQAQHSNVRPPSHGQEAVAPDAASAQEAGRQPGAAQDEHRHLFSVSVGRSPALYWMGRFDAASCTLDLAGARGPLPLDMGDLLYAPNVLQDAQGRIILWGWLSELPNPGGKHDYAGALSLPRLLQLHHGRLHQQPLPELAQLRKPEPWQAEQIIIHPDKPHECIAGGKATTFADLQLTLDPGSSSPGGVAGLLIGPTTALNGMEATGQAARLHYDFSSCKLTVEVGAVSDIMDSKPAYDMHSTPTKRRVLGGVLEGMQPRQPLQLRVLLDYSLLEVFTGDGSALATRVYRCSTGLPVAGQGGMQTGLWLYAVGKEVTARQVTVHEMASIWE